MNNKYFFKKDGLQWMLMERGIAGEKAKKPGDATEKAEGYYGQIAHAAMAMREALVRDNCPESANWDEVIEAVKVSTKQVEAALKEIGGQERY